MLERLLPAGVVCREAFDDRVPAPLPPEEARAVAHALDKRRREFATARRCAREALTALGVPVRALPSGKSREPRWPDGVVGSITHCDGYRAAAVASSVTMATLGVDAEPHERLPRDVLVCIASPGEVDSVMRSLAIDSSVCWDRLLFCAKEAVYKAWFPLAQCWLGFEEVTVSFGRPRGTFTARLHAAHPLVHGRVLVTEFAGRWLVDRGLILTAIALPVGDPDGQPVNTRACPSFRADVICGSRKARDDGELVEVSAVIPVHDGGSAGSESRAWLLTAASGTLPYSAGCARR